MEDEPTAFGLSHEKLAKLWALADDTAVARDGLTKDQNMVELLCDRLAEPLPLDPTATHTLPAALSHVLEHFSPFLDASVEALLFNPDTDPSVIWQIKDRYRKKAESHPVDPERQVAKVIYYAAIASAVLFHQESLFRENRITTFSKSELETHFSQLLDICWLTPNLTDLFKKACAVCRARKKTSDR